MQSSDIQITVSCLIFLLVFVSSIILLFKLKFEQSGYKLLFILYTVFWIPLMLLRQYTGEFQKGLDKTILWLPLAAYGFVGIFARIFADFFTFSFKSRKTFIYLALMIQILTYIPVLILPSTATNVIQSIGVGIGASCIGTYELFFNEQYGKSQQFLTISVLSIPPLLADFISSPIQACVVAISQKNNPDKITNQNPEVLKWLWLIGLILVLVAIILTYFVKEDKKLFAKDVQYKQIIYNTNEWVYYVLIVLVGSLVAFIKFGNSGGVGTSFFTSLLDRAGQGDKKAIGAYTSIIFSFVQLIGGLLTTLLLVKYLSKWKTFSLGIICWIVFHLVLIFNVNPWVYLGMFAINGFSYGILYNLILGTVLQKRFNLKKASWITPMGIYQSCLSIGITCSNFFTTFLTSTVGTSANNNFNIHNYQIVNIVLLSAVVLLWIIYSYSYIISKNNYATLKPWILKKC